MKKKWILIIGGLLFFSFFVVCGYELYARGGNEGAYQKIDFVSLASMDESCLECHLLKTSDTIQEYRNLYADNAFQVFIYKVKQKPLFLLQVRGHLSCGMQSCDTGLISVQGGEVIELDKVSLPVDLYLFECNQSVYLIAHGGDGYGRWKVSMEGFSFERNFSSLADSVQCN